MPSYKSSGMSLQRAINIAYEVITILLKNNFSKTMITGSILRRALKVGDIDLMVQGDLSVLNDIKDFGIKELGNTKGTFIYKGQQVNIWRYEDEYYGAMLFHLTGPQYYNVAYRRKAKNLGWLLNQYGLYDEKNNKIAGETEESIYKALGKNWKSPELRGK